MEIEQKNMENRIISYDEFYGFLENASGFNFDNNPHRLIIKNYALRNKDRFFYEIYLREAFPDYAQEELNDFDSQMIYLKAFGEKELSIWLINNDVQLLQADINVTDKDAIFRVVPLLEDESTDKYLEEQEGLILNYISPLSLLKFPYRVWVNTELHQFATSV